MMARCTKCQTAHYDTHSKVVVLTEENFVNDVVKVFKSTCMVTKKKLSRCFSIMSTLNEALASAYSSLQARALDVQLS